MGADLIKNKENIGKQVGATPDRQSRARVIVPILVLIGFIVFAVFYLAGEANANDSLSSSGTVEAVEIRIGPEIGGTVKEVLVEQGDRVDQGQPLVHLDNAILQNQRDQAEANLAQAEALVQSAELGQESAQQAYDKLVDGSDPDSNQLALAEGSLQAAQAQLVAAQANQAAAEAALDSADIQIGKAELVSPVSGTVLYRNIEAGEVVSPGATIIVVADLSDLTITVYLPEDRYGKVNLGDNVEVEVDSFPGEKFNATVTHIADQAEFTPRNVQTGEGRRTTVFAIELKLDDPQGKLKPGMPADVYFSR